ncbi:MAG: PepSY domain-containing protein [Blastocatellia bacterium]|nr:PepSY domain-containing protein [Blastocatellia bacterium]
MKLFRTVIFWCHLLAGVVTGVIILVMSVTGALLAFEPQIIQAAERNVRTVQPPAGAARLNPQALLTNVREIRPDAKPAGITVLSDPTAAVMVSLGRDGVLFVNPYTGQVLGESAKGVRDFFRLMEDWHRWLGKSGEGRDSGRAVTGFCNAAFLLLAVSGLYLWWPKNWTSQYLWAVTVMNFKLKGRARDFNWHNAIGFWSAPVLIFVTATGMVMSYQWANNLLYTLTGSERPAPPPQTAAPPGRPNGPAKPETSAPAGPEPNLEQLWAKAENQAPGWKVISLRLPLKNGAPVTFTIDEGKSWNPFGRSQLTLQPGTAEVVKWEPYGDLNAGRKLRSWSRSVHTGEALGIPGQFLAGAASLGGGFLVWTGLTLAWRRFRSWQEKRRTGLQPAT